MHWGARGRVVKSLSDNQVITPILTFPLRGGRDNLKDSYPCQPVKGEGGYRIGSRQFGER